jgi:type IV pilus assembly protein PilW
MKKSAGFTLVELMIALVLGLIVVGGSLALFVSQRVSSNFSGQMGEVQSEGRIALDAIARDLRAAGDFGCWPVQNPIEERLHDSTVYRVADGGLVAFDMTASTTAVAGIHHGSGAVIAASPKAGSTVFGVKGVSGVLSHLTAAMESQSSDLVMTSPPTPFADNDLAVITDCINWAKFHVSAAVRDANAGTTTLKHEAAPAALSDVYGGGNKSGAIGEVFKVGAMVGRLDTVWWYVKADGLYRYSAATGAHARVSSLVHSLQVRFDIDADGNGAVDATDQAPAGGTAWSKVRVAHVKILMRSAKSGGSERTSPVTDFEGQSVPADGHIYFPLEMTIALRNQ